MHPTIAVRDDATIAWAVRKNSPELPAMLNSIDTHLGPTPVDRWLERLRDASPAEGRHSLEALCPLDE